MKPRTVALLAFLIGTGLAVGIAVMIAEWIIKRTPAEKVNAKFRDLMAAQDWDGMHLVPPQAGRGEWQDSE